MPHLKLHYFLLKGKASDSLHRRMAARVRAFREGGGHIPTLPPTASLSPGLTREWHSPTHHPAVTHLARTRTEFQRGWGWGRGRVPPAYSTPGPATKVSLLSPGQPPGSPLPGSPHLTALPGSPPSLGSPLPRSPPLPGSPLPGSPPLLGFPLPASPPLLDSPVLGSLPTAPLACLGVSSTAWLLSPQAARVNPRLRPGNPGRWHSPRGWTALPDRAGGRSRAAVLVAAAPGCGSRAGRVERSFPPRRTPRVI